ncbi:MAG: hypothetical protein QXS27_06575, partial [Candidatus Jordarchaeaceae archaeon]
MSIKMKINEVCFVIYSLPSPLTKATMLSDRKSITFHILPKEFANELIIICTNFRYHAKKVLRSIIPGRLYFIKYPLAKYKPMLDSLISEYNERLKEYADKVYNHVDELKKSMAEFCEKYDVDRQLNEVILTRDYFRARFKIQHQLLPIKLNGGLSILTPEDVRAIENSIREMVERSYRDLLNHELSAFFKLLEEQLKRLQSGKMVKAHTLEKLWRSHEDVNQAFAIVGDERYKPAF